MRCPHSGLIRYMLFPVVLTVCFLILVNPTQARAQDVPVTNVVTFHVDPQRTGWISTETLLTPVNVNASTFGLLWNSPQLDSITIGTTTYPPHVYATPLYVDDVLITGGTFAGSHFSVVVAASSNGFVYAINAFDVANPTTVPAGTILWRKSLGAPRPANLDGGMPLGVLSTPVIDLSTTPPSVYVASDVTDSSRNWKVFALDLGSGNILPGWPLAINNSTLSPINQNGPATFQAAENMSQRGALNLSPDGGLLYVPFGSYSDGGAGWMVAVDTLTPSLKSAFSGAPYSIADANGGMWGSGGAAVDALGIVYDTTGNGPSGSRDVPNFWGESLLVWAAGAPLQLVGTYTPWNYCQMDDADTDLVGSTPMILPDLDPSTTTTPHLVTFGSKQGTAYIVDRDNLPGGTSRRPPCNFTDSSLDTSLLGPDPQPPFGQPGPLSVFGPYSETYTQVDFAKMRTTPAFFRGADGSSNVFVSGATKSCLSCREPVPPGLARLRLVTTSGQPAYLTIDAADSVLRLFTPVSPLVTSNASNSAIVWVLDTNLYRSDPLVGTNVHPTLYALDANTMNLLWNSTPAQLNVGGKYNTVTVARGTVFVGTDRIQAFGLLPAIGVRNSKSSGKWNINH